LVIDKIETSVACGQVKVLGPIFKVVAAMDAESEIRLVLDKNLG
jgi:hypothetical protein